MKWVLGVVLVMIIWIASMIYWFEQAPLLTLFIGLGVFPGALFTISVSIRSYCNGHGFLTWRVAVFSVFSLCVVPVGILGAFAPVGNKKYCENEETRKNDFMAFGDWAAGKVPNETTDGG